MLYDMHSKVIERPINIERFNHTSLETKFTVVYFTDSLTDCDDIAIIGAGITGSYAAWRLREKSLKISLYEYSGRIGGRCFTVQLPGIPDVNVEMGAMRFKPNGK